MRRRYPIEKKMSQSINKVYLPELLLADKQLARLAFGSRAAEAEFIPWKKNKILIDAPLFEELYIPEEELLLHAFIDEETLFLGPLIGVLTSGFTSYPLKPAGERSHFFAKLLAVNKSVGVLPFLFGEEHVDWDRGLIKGWFYIQDSWKVAEVPLPNVIYDRLPNRRAEKLAEKKHIKERMLSDYLIPSYNPGFFSKLDVFERLYQEPLASLFLPETHPFTSYSLIERMLADYGHVYVKPANGSLGYGIHQIIYERSSGKYCCRYQDQKGTKKLTRFPSLESLVNSLFDKKRLSSYVVQQGINLIRAEDRLVDFRVHTHKDENGKWNVAAIAAKLGGIGSPTTHIRNGGKVRTVNEVFSDQREADKFTKLLENASLCLSEAIERQMEGIIGEIGFDLGIDKEGRIWMFEANSKPGRSIFSHPLLKGSDLKTRKLMLGFGVFLTEKVIFAPEALFS